jgi:hypothetical protein
MGRYGLGGGGSSLHSGIEFGRSRTGKGSSGGGEEGSGVRSGPGAARTILLFHIIIARPSKHPLMVRTSTFLKVYMDLVSYFLFLQEQVKDIIISRNFLLDFKGQMKGKSKNIWDAK